jgi:hypothetical protein
MIENLLEITLLAFRTFVSSLITPSISNYKAFQLS